MITVGTFSKPEEAHLFRMRLEAVGFEAFVQNEHIVQLNSFLWIATGGVRVQIPDEELADLREFLSADAPQTSSDVTYVACPRCGSHDTAPDEWPRRVAYIFVFLFWFPVYIGRHRWRCGSCGCGFRYRL